MINLNRYIDPITYRIPNWVFKIFINGKPLGLFYHSISDGPQPLIQNLYRVKTKAMFERDLNLLKQNFQLIDCIEADDEKVRINVDDAGPGVDETLRERLFEPFARGNAAHRTEGAGLGLAIALEQSHVLKGDLWVETSPQGGARFVAELPITPEGS